MQRLQPLVFSLLNRHHFSPPSDFYKKSKNKPEKIFGVSKIPTDTQAKNLLDPLAPSLFYHLFPFVVKMLKEEGMLKNFQRYDEKILISNDGT